MQAIKEIKHSCLSIGVISFQTSFLGDPFLLYNEDGIFSGGALKSVDCEHWGRKEGHFLHSAFKCTAWVDLHALIGPHFIHSHVFPGPPFTVKVVSRPPFGPHPNETMTKGRRKKTMHVAYHRDTGSKMTSSMFPTEDTTFSEESKTILKSFFPFFFTHLCWLQVKTGRVTPGDSSSQRMIIRKKYSGSFINASVCRLRPRKVNARGWGAGMTFRWTNTCPVLRHGTLCSRSPQLLLCCPPLEDQKGRWGREQKLILTTCLSWSGRWKELWLLPPEIVGLPPHLWPARLLREGSQRRGSRFVKTAKALYGWDPFSEQRWLLGFSHCLQVFHLTGFPLVYLSVLCVSHACLVSSYPSSLALDQDIVLGSFFLRSPKQTNIWAFF